MGGLVYIGRCEYPFPSFFSFICPVCARVADAPRSFIGGSAFCGKICDQFGSNLQGLCNNIYDHLGCEYNAPANVEANTFEYVCAFSFLSLPLCVRSFSSGVEGRVRDARAVYGRLGRNILCSDSRLVVADEDADADEDAGLGRSAGDAIAKAPEHRVGRVTVTGKSESTLLPSCTRRRRR